MTQVKLWQIVSQTANAIIFSDADGNLTTLAAPGADQILVSAGDGTPMWADNTALQTALQAQTDAANAIATANAYTQAQIAALVGGAPLALDTLNELAQKLTSEETALNALIAQMETKANTATVTALVTQSKDEAITESNAYTDTRVASALVTASSTSQAQADAARTAAVAAASTESVNRIVAFQNAIPGTYRTVGTSVASYVSDSDTLDWGTIAGNGVVVKDTFTEITGAANIGQVDQSLVAKMLLVNGVAMHGQWSTETNPSGQLVLKFSPQLAGHFFDGGQNSVMLLVEYKSYGTIEVIPGD